MYANNILRYTIELSKWSSRRENICNEGLVQQTRSVEILIQYIRKLGDFHMGNRVPQSDLDRGKKETVGQKTCGRNQCPNIMPQPQNDSRLAQSTAGMSQHLLLTPKMGL